MEIMKMSAREVFLIGEFANLAKEAMTAAALIKNHFNTGFGLDTKKIHVYHTESCGEYYGDGYLTIDGEFIYQDNWWGGREYKFTCDEDGIYKMLRSCYLKRNNLEEMEEEKFNCQIEHIDAYFREFIKEISNDE